MEDYKEPGYLPENNLKFEITTNQTMNTQESNAVDNGLEE